MTENHWGELADRMAPVAYERHQQFIHEHGVWNPMSQQFEKPVLSLADFLLARITEDEQPTRRCLCDCFEGSAAECEARWLAGCRAKRRILGLAQQAALRGHEARVKLRDGKLTEIERGFYELGAETEAQRLYALSDAVKSLAVLYADHPDYRDEWRPDGVG